MERHNERKLLAVMAVCLAISGCDDNKPAEWWKGNYMQEGNREGGNVVVFEDSGPISKDIPTCPPQTSKIIEGGRRITGTLATKNSLLGIGPPVPDCVHFTFPGFIQPTTLPQ